MFDNGECFSIYTLKWAWLSKKGILNYELKIPLLTNNRLVPKFLFQIKLLQLLKLY